MKHAPGPNVWTAYAVTNSGRAKFYAAGLCEPLSIANNGLAVEISARSCETGDGLSVWTGLA